MTPEPFTLLDEAILDGVVAMPALEEDRWETALAELAFNGRTQIGDFQIWLDYGG